MFEDATFHSSNIQPSQTPKWMLLALAVNLATVAAMIVLPLLYPEGLPNRFLNRILYAPAPAPVVLPTTHSTPSPTQSTQISLNPFTAPTQIPTTIDRTPDAPPANLNPFATSNGDLVTGAIPTPSAFRPGTPPTAVHPAQPHKTTISTGVAQGLLLFHPSPAYPPIAIAARVSGTVLLAATISPAGTIENLRVLSGSPMLTTAALEAVKTWRYRPYQLNNQPVEVDTTINVIFSLGSR